MAQKREQEEALDWADAKIKKKQLEEQKAAEKLKKKQELKELEAAEAKQLQGLKKPKAAEVQRLQKKPPSSSPIAPAIAASPETTTTVEPVQEFSASNIDDALDLLAVATDNLNIVGGEGALDRHPERRAKQAYKSFEERMLKELREDQPSLRLSQLKQEVWKLWQKSGENPLNQSEIKYNSTQDDQQQVLQRKKEQIEQRLGTTSKPR